jgi:hypothetical protein
MGTIRSLLIFLALAIPAVLFGQVGELISIGPPPLPVYEQPICPGDGYLWTPGYWAYDDSISDYYWVDGAWVLVPEEGFLWTPGYWGWKDGGFIFNDGYWGQEVGFYGGINYGFGYFGEGYGGGRWDHGHFFYNRSVNNVDISINHNVYNTAIESHNENRVSFNGGAGGIAVHANQQQEAVARGRHLAPVAAQNEHVQAARANPEARASVNHGKPGAGATTLPVGYNDRQTAAPQQAAEAFKSPVNGTETQPRSEVPARPPNSPPTRAVVHPNDLSPIARPAPVNSGDAKADKRYEQQQDNLIARQTQERQQLQVKQDTEHQQKMNDAQTQKLGQKHQQQTQVLAQKHTVQQQSLQARQPQPRLSEPRARK